MLRSSFSWLGTLLIALVLTACGGGDNGATIPFATAAEVQAAFNRSQPLLGAGTQVSPDPKSMADPTDFESRGVTSAGVPVVLMLRFYYRLVPTSKVSVGGTLVPELQQILARFDGRDFPAPVLDIREYEGWLLLYASLRPYTGFNWRVERWVMYHPETKQFVDCGEVGSIRPAELGPAVPSSCVQR